MPPNERPDGFEWLGQGARVDYRLLKEDQVITPDLEHALLGELRDWRRDHRTQDGRPMPWKKLGELIGIPHSTLTEVVAGKYKGNRQNQLRKIDRFLAEDRERAGRFDIRQHAEISLTRRIFGVIRAGVRNNSMPVIIGEPGSGKSVHARAFASERGGVVVIRPDETFCDARGVTYLFCQAIEGLQQSLHRPHPKRLATIRSYLQKHRNIVIIVDECQQLSREGLTCLRNIHDTSDPEGRRNVPIIFFGDEHFYRLLVRSRSGERSPIAPQMTRRMYPVFDIGRDAADGEGAEAFTVEDLVRILRNDRVRVITPDGVRWLARLANVRGWGSLGFAIAIARMGFDIASKMPLDVDDLWSALRMTIGPQAVEEIDEAVGGELLRHAC